MIKYDNGWLTNALYFFNTNLPARGVNRNIYNKIIISKKWKTRWVQLEEQFDHNFNCTIPEIVSTLLDNVVDKVNIKCRISSNI